MNTPTLKASTLERHDLIGIDSRTKILGLLAVLAACGALLAWLSASALANGARLFTGTFGGASSTVTDPYPLGEAWSIAVDSSNGPSSGDVYVADTKYRRVEKFDSTGQFMFMFGGGVIAAAVEGVGDLTAGSKEVASVTTSERAFLPTEEVTGAGIPAGTHITGVGVGTLTLSNAATASGAKIALTVAEGAGNVANNEQQKVTLEHSPTGGSFRLTFTSATVEGVLSKGSAQVTGTHEASGVLHVGDVTGLASVGGQGDLTAGSSIVSKVIVGSGEGAFANGQMVEGRGIPAGTTIVAVGSETLTLSTPAIESRGKDRLVGRSTVAAIDAATGSFTLSSPSLSGGGSRSEEITTSETTTAIPYNASSSEVQQALESLAGIGAGNVSVTGTAGGPWTVEFKGPLLSDTDVPQLSADATALTPAGGQASVTTLLAGHSTPEVCETGCQPGSEGSTPGAFESEMSVAVDTSAGFSAGDVYVGERIKRGGSGATRAGVEGEGAVAKFDEEGHLLSGWGTGGQVESSGSAPLGAVQGVAVDPSGNVWIDGTGVHEGNLCPGSQGFCPGGRLFELKQEDTYVRDWDVFVNGNVVGQSGPLEVDREGHVYIDTQNFGRGGDVYEHTSTGEEIKQITASEFDSSPGAFAFDSSTDSIFQGTNTSGGSSVLYRYEASCQAGPFSQGCVPAETFSSSHFRNPSSQSGGLAVDPNAALDTLYDAQRGEVAMFSVETLPDVTTQPASGFTSTSATLNGAVNPEGGAITQCYFEWGEGEGSQYEHTVACEAPDAGEVGGGGAPVAVHAKISMQLGRTYHFRLVAANVNQLFEPTVGSDVVFGPPRIDSTSVAQVTTESATFQAQVDPRNVNVEYHFEYLTEAEYDENGESFKGAHPAVSVPVPDGSLGSGEADLLASRHVRGLVVHKAYRYRVVVHSRLAEGVEAVDGPTDSFTTWAGGSFGLPDGRQWEMVSSPGKEGALIEPIGEDWVIQAAANGGRMAYVARTATEADPQGTLVYQSVLATRGSGGGWSSHDLSVPHAAATTLSVGRGWEYRFFSEDLSRAIVQPFGTFVPCVSSQGEAQPCISPHASEQTAFLDGLYTGEGSREPCSSSCFTPLVTGAEGYANVPPHTTFGQLSAIFDESCPPSLMCGPMFLDATPDAGHVVLESYVPLTLSSAAGKGIPPKALYEWSEGRPPSEQLRLVSVLPGNAKGEALPAEEPVFGIKTENRNSRRAISDDGSRVVWGSGGHLYLRENATEPQSPLGSSGECLQAADACTVQLDAGLSGQASFQTANAQDTRIFFTEGGDLYVYEVQGGKPVALTKGGGLVGAVVGASEGGSSIYYAGGGALAPGAVEGKCGQGESCNLYVSHYGAGEWETPKLIAVLSGSDNTVWGGGGGLELKDLAARVSPNGRWLAFVSQRSLTGYDNSDALSGEPDDEVYEYDAEAESLTCASCNPTGSRPHGLEAERIETKSGGIAGGNLVTLSRWVGASLPGWTPNDVYGAIYQPRFLSDSGRLFMNAADALVSKDINGTEDVYEYEPEGAPGGERACGSSSASGSIVFKAARETEVEGRRLHEAAGCVGLISSGESPQESAFLDASETGSEVFFITTGKLSSEDVDSSYDVYDARECTQQSPCAPEPAARPGACTTETSCRPAPSPQPEIFGPSGSQTFSGPGNLAPSTPVAPVTKKAKPSTRKQKLSAALKACHRDRVKRKRKRCEKAALHRYGSAARSELSRTSNVNRGRRAK